VTGTESAATSPSRTCAHCKARRAKHSAAPAVHAVHAVPHATCRATIRATAAADLTIHSGAFQVRNVFRQFAPLHAAPIASRPHRTGLSGQWHGYRYRTGGIRLAMNDPAACANRRAELHPNGSAPRHAAHRRHRAWQTMGNRRLPNRAREGESITRAGATNDRQNGDSVPRTSRVSCSDTRRAKRTRGAMRPATR
jgi:hypothetical protein